MPLQTVIQRSFLGGEIAPALAARADQSKYLSGLRTCRNFLVRRHGGVTKRPGYRYVWEAKDSAAVRLVPFVFEGADQTYLLEFGDGYVRFYWHGAIVLDGLDPYEVETPYGASDVARLKWSQSADVLTITHPSYAPQELKRLGHINWTISDYVTAPSISAPGSLSSAAGAAGTLNMKYVVTAARDNFEESYASSPETIALCAAPTPEAPNIVSWGAVTGPPAAAEYRIYCDPHGNGLYGFVSAVPATQTTFHDVGFVPDFTLTPPTQVTLFASSGNYPRAVNYFQQRQLFGGSNSQRERVWGSQVGSYHNHSTSVPLQDDDAIALELAGNQLNPVTHLLDRLVFTDGAVHALRGDDTGAILPTAFNPDQVSSVGASEAVRPIVVGTDVLYVQSRGAVLRALSPNVQQQANSYAGFDLTIFASHLFDGYALIDLAFALQPHSIAWAVRSDGVLLGLTYLKEQDVWGWHRHDTGAGGVVENVCVLPDTTAGVDVLYLVVRRTIDGETKRYIETLEQPYRHGVDDPEDAFYVDSGLTYDGAPVSTITGLDHLEGERVAILADGAVISDGSTDSHVVAGGEVALGVSASKVQAGLPIRFAQIETLSLDADGTSVRGKRKRVQALTVLAEGSTRGFLAGPTEDDLIANRPEPWQSSADEPVADEALELNLTSRFDDTGRIVLRHTDPTPFTVNAVLPLMELGG